MGSVDQPGLIPRLCSALFERTQKEQREEESFTVEVSYMEIYNEKVRDLLDPKGYNLNLVYKLHFQVQTLGTLIFGSTTVVLQSRTVASNFKYKF